LARITAQRAERNLRRPSSRNWVMSSKKLMNVVTGLSYWWIPGKPITPPPRLSCERLTNSWRFRFPL
jgi:hypothetical protein